MSRTFTAAWSTGLCDCCNGDRCGQWALACVCPCLQYSKNLATIKRLGIASDVPVWDDNALLPGALYAVAVLSVAAGAYTTSGGSGACGLLPPTMQCATRGNVRAAYAIPGDCCNDCCTVCFCASCALVQEAQQLRLLPTTASAVAVETGEPLLHNTTFRPPADAFYGHV